MRADMEDVLLDKCRRPQRRFSASKRRFHKKTQLPLLDLPQKEGIATRIGRSRRGEGGPTPSILVERWLCTSCGRPWSKVHSEINKAVKRYTSEWWTPLPCVAHPVYLYNDELCWSGRFGPISLHRDPFGPRFGSHPYFEPVKFYVDTTGILRRRPVFARKPRIIQGPHGPLSLLKLYDEASGENRHFHLDVSSGRRIWREIVFGARVSYEWPPRREPVIDVLHRRWVYQCREDDRWLRKVYAGVHWVVTAVRELTAEDRRTLLIR